MIKNYYLNVMVAMMTIVGISPTLLFAQDEANYSSHIKNADFEEGGDPDAFVMTGYSMGFYAPKGWTMTMSANTTWGAQHFTPAAYTESNPSINGWQSESGWSVPQLFPTSGSGYYQHSLWQDNAAVGAFHLSQVVNTLPAGRYRLTVDGSVIEQDETGWFKANGMNFYASVTPANSSTVQVEFPHYLNPFVSTAATVAPELTTMTLDFALLDDNEPLEIKAWFNYFGEMPYVGGYQLQAYLDNFTLTRTGDVSVEDMINGVNMETEGTYIPLLESKYNELGLGNEPESWTDIIFGYLDPVPDGLATVAEAIAYQNQVIDWTNRIDTLLNQRDEFILLLDSANVLKTYNYEGVAAFSEQVEILSATLNERPDVEQMQAAIDRLNVLILEYLFSGLSGATPENPVNLTFLITNPGVDGEVGPTSATVARGWTIEVSGSTQPYLGTGNNYEDETPNTGSYFNTWDGTVGAAKYLATQTLTGLPAGVYRIGGLLSGDASGEGTYIFALANGVYSAAEGQGGDVFRHVVVDNIVVINGELTIGATTKGDQLWGGRTFGGYWFSADDFELYYCNPDVSVVIELLKEAIAAAEEVVTNASGSILGGDLAEVQGILAAANAVADVTPIDVAAVSEVLVAVNSIAGKVAASVAAYDAVAVKIAEAEIVAEEPLVTETALSNLTNKIAEAAVWLADPTSLAVDYTTITTAIDAAIRTANESKMENVTPGNPLDVTFLIVNPDQAQGSTGYTMVNNNVEYFGVPSDYFATPTNHLCYWQGSTKPDASFNYYQTINDLPNGYYRLTVNGVYSAAYATDNSTWPNDNVVLYGIGDPYREKRLPLTSQAVIEGDTLDATYKVDNRPVLFTLDSVRVGYGYLTFGVKSIGFISATTVRVYGFTLTYLEKAGSTIGVEEIGAEKVEVSVQDGYVQVSNGAPYTITTVNGTVLPPYSKLSAGIYIVKVGEQVTKVIVQ